MTAGREFHCRPRSWCAGVVLSSGLAFAAGHGQAQDQERLTSALAAVEVAHVRADLEFLASDLLEGREAPSRGLELAALFLSTRLERTGFEPAGGEGFLQRFSVGDAWPGADSRAELCFDDGPWIALVSEVDQSIPDDDWQAFELEGEIVYVDPGHLPEDVQLAGTWALLPHGEVGRERLEALRERGVLGLLIAHGDPRAGSLFRERPGLRVIREAPKLPVAHLGERITQLLLPGGPPSSGERVGARYRERRAPRAVGSLANVAGLWRGSDADLAGEVVVLSAHYDHLGRKGDTIFNGANDNGSGSCALLAVAEALVHHGPLRRSVLLVWTAGEEKGLLGSLAWTTAPVLPAGYSVVANVNVDGIGHGRPDQLHATPSPAHPRYGVLSVTAAAAARAEGFVELESCDASWSRSDQWNFHTYLGVPVVAFLEAWASEHYHEPSDTTERVDCDKVCRVARMLTRLVIALDAVDIAR